MNNTPPHHRKSIRLKEYDYTLAGAYFVTVVTYNRQCLFVKIAKNNVDLSDLGKIAQDCWLEIPEHFNDVQINPFIVMPNHIHGIINTVEQTNTIPNNACRGTIYRAPTTENFGHPVEGSIPTIVRTYKAAVSRIAHRKLHIRNIWQRNYYEHIIRDQDELEIISSYIQSNSENWTSDPEFKQLSPQ